MREKTISPPLLIDYGVAISLKPGETKSGDQYLVKSTPRGTLVAVVDGLGHGDKAYTAAKTAVDSLAQTNAPILTDLAGRCHQALLKTRGAVIGLAFFSNHETSLEWLGIGNIEGLLIHATSQAPNHKWLTSSGGIVGYQLPTLRSSSTGVEKGDVLIITTDGVKSSFAAEAKHLDRLSDKKPQQLADFIIQNYVRHTDDALALTARYNGIIS